MSAHTIEPMRARPALVIASALLLAGCSNPPVEPTTTSAAETVQETFTLTIEVVDAVPLDLASNVDDKTCRPSALFSKVDDARMPSFVVEDADGTTVATGEMSRSGKWADESCTLSTDLGEVPASDFYTVYLTGDDGLFEVEPFALEKVVEAEPVDDVLTVEWAL